MDIFRNDILEEMRSHFNEPVLVSNVGVGRLIGYGQDAMDCYWIIKFPTDNFHPMVLDLKNRIMWHSAVGGIYYLDKLKDQNVVEERGWNDLVRISGDLERYGAPPEAEFQVIINDENPFTKKE